MFDDDSVRRNSVYRTMNVEEFYVEPFETVDEVLRIGRRYDVCMIADHGPWANYLESKSIEVLSSAKVYIAYSDQPDIQRIVDVVRKGASGYLVFPFSFEAAKPSLDLVDSAKPRRVGSKNGGKAYLTAREEELASLLAEGLSTDELARAMGITRRTVEWHRFNMRNKVIDGIDRMRPTRKTRKDRSI
ncbi:LuxR C-terminal-related transcriptional regulator [Croceicoccus sediminis]|uniref:LuxR C-terminal-related transcriptional regulator n=1 Tax=Croceicoccus sediminis TaxID=2571150 RepID=UPI00196A1FB7|nr:LuxR C-terminal-related transcriptional regulator [Croceicoccus sediminis]